MATPKSNYEAETRLNDRGGWEIGFPGDKPGTGEGNYPTETDAYSIARYNFEPKRIKRGTEPEPVKTRRRVKALVAEAQINTTTPHAWENS